MMKELEKRRANKLLFLFDNYLEVRYNFGMVVKRFDYHLNYLVEIELLLLDILIMSFRELNYYNLDMIISIGYRVKSKNGVVFRKWASY